MASQTIMTGLLPWRGDPGVLPINYVLLMVAFASLHALFLGFFLSVAVWRYVSGVPAEAPNVWLRRYTWTTALASFTLYLILTSVTDLLAFSGSRSFLPIIILGTILSILQHVGVILLLAITLLGIVPTVLKLTRQPDSRPIILGLTGVVGFIAILAVTNIGLSTGLTFSIIHRGTISEGIYLALRILSLVYSITYLISVTAAAVIAGPGVLKLLRSANTRTSGILTAVLFAAQLVFALDSLVAIILVFFQLGLGILYATLVLLIFQLGSILAAFISVFLVVDELPNLPEIDVDEAAEPLLRAE